MAEFNAKQQLPGLLDWMRAQMKACGGKTAVIGISGGKDSSVTAALSVAAYGRENVVGVLMTDGPLKGLLARSVVVIDGDGKVVYTELVPEITQEPDYDKALAAVKR